MARWGSIVVNLRKKRYEVSRAVQEIEVSCRRGVSKEEVCAYGKFPAGLDQLTCSSHTRHWRTDQLWRLHPSISQVSMQRVNFGEEGFA